MQSKNNFRILRSTVLCLNVQTYVCYGVEIILLDITHIYIYIYGFVIIVNKNYYNRIFLTPCKFV